MGETEVLTRLEAEADLKGEGEKSTTELVKNFQHVMRRKLQPQTIQRDTKSEIFVRINENEGSKEEDSKSMCVCI